MSKQNFIPAFLLYALAALLHLIPAAAQEGGPGIEQWKSFLPYGQVTGVVSDGVHKLYCATTAGFFTYDRESGALDAYSKVNGMSDVGMAGVAYDKTTGIVVLGYSNSNIDLFQDGSFYNIPFLKNQPGGGDRSINALTASDGRAYLSTGSGLMIINLDKKEIKETVDFIGTDGISGRVQSAAVNATHIYAATTIGLFRIEKNNPSILNMNAWEKLDERTFEFLAQTVNGIYAAKKDSLFYLAGGLTATYLEKVAASDTIRHLDAGTDGLWLTVGNGSIPSGYGVEIGPGGTRIDSFSTVSPTQVCQLGDGTVWFGDNSNYMFPDRHGLRKKVAVNQSEPYFPEGPVTNSSFDVSAYNGELWVAHGGRDTRWISLRNRSMFSHYTAGKWTNYPWVGGGDWVQDFIRILKDQSSGKVYAASFSGGLYEMDLKGGNTTLYGKGYFDQASGSDSLFYISGLALDPDGNLWITNNTAVRHELVVKTREGQWISARSIDENTGHSAADVIVDDYGQKWFIAVNNGGVVVYNDNGTLENTADDRYRILKAGGGAGNLPDNNTLSIVKDKDGAIWVGTSNGIGIINCGDQVITDRSCEAELRVVQIDQFGGYLFEGQAVKAMAVDGANRKWIGTSNGVWLLSEDASEIIYRFTVDNSPLPSNTIERINIDPVTGDVYFSTGSGLVSFRSTATEGSAENADELFIYPNPVPSGFEGMIAVRGVAENADVRFTDISGQLVYRTKALGGQAVWNGKDYTGRKVQSGVYLVFVVNRDGTQKATGKFMLHH